MSEDDRPPNSLSALSGLTRSGPSHSNDPIDGAAKGEDSGLIDLRAMSAPAPEAAAAAAEPAVAHDSGSISVREMSKPAAPTARAASEKSADVAAAPAAPAVAAAAVAAPKKDEKKKGAGLWIALGGLAAAAAVAAVVIPMSKKSDEAPSASAQSSDKGAEKADEKKKDEKVAVAPAASAAPTAEMPAASASAAANEPDPAATVAAAPTGAYAGGSAAKAMQTTPGGMPAKAGSDKGPDPKAPPPAPSSDPIKKPAGGSLDDVLGIGKGNEPVAKKSDPNENLPDKPDSMDVRSAINGKVGAARACVKGHSEASSVSVTFGPGGSVSAVVVTSGEAKGTGAEACIKGAFSTAKVPPSKKGASGSAVLQP
ncbi:MAG: hypothetical protein ACXWUG_05740 [Polyangiales bacterium]